MDINNNSENVIEHSFNNQDNSLQMELNNIENNEPQNNEEHSFPIDIYQNYESAMLNLLNYLINNNIFNTYITADDEDAGQFSIILKTKKPTLKQLLGHLNKPQRIKPNDPLLEEHCSICFEQYEVGQLKRTLDTCNHVFHKKCIDKWFRKNSDDMNCPVCRKNYNRRINLSSTNL